MIGRWLVGLLRTGQRLHLALRYYRRLRYTWHLAWLKAAR